LSDGPGQYCDRCVGDGVHKQLYWFLGFFGALYRLSLRTDHRVTLCATFLVAT